MRIDVSSLASPGFRAAVLDNLSDGVYFVDRDRRITYWNRAASRISGFSEHEVLGRACRDGLLNHVDADGKSLCGSQCPLMETMSDGEPRETHVYMHHKEGHLAPVCVRAAPLRDDTGRIIGAIETFSDDSTYAQARDRLSALERASFTDELTGLHNRRYAQTTLERWLHRHEHDGWPFGVVFVDIDHFKRVNDRYGHQVGDEALRVVARTLAHASRQDDVVARWGGEEFVILVADARPDGLRVLARRLVALVRQTRIVAYGHSVDVSISAGATLAERGESLDRLVGRADFLLYESKAGGRDRVTLAA